MSRPLVRNRNTAITVGVAMFLGGALLLHDAFEGRGQDTPWWARPFTFW